MFYRIEPEAGTYGRIHSATDSDGEPIDDPDRQLVPDQCFSATVSGNTRIGDFAHSISRELVVSRAAWDELNLHRIQAEIASFPVTITHEGLPIHPDYHLILPKKRFDIVDRDQAEIELINGHLFDVHHWVLDPAKTPALDLYYADPGDWIISRALKERIDRLGLTGLRTIELDGASPTERSS